MKKKVGWGILGAGFIAEKFAAALEKVGDSEISAVASRSRGKAEEFARRFSARKFYSAYEDMVCDPDVDIVYIATPHNYHQSHALLAMEGGKAVLCEKPMSITYDSVKTMIDKARKERVFLMEAHWTRFLPVFDTVRSWLADHLIGEIRMLQADFGFRSNGDPEGRLLNPELAGGSIFDVGVYPISLAQMIFGKEPLEIEAEARIGETGVDEDCAFVLKYPSGALASLSCSVMTETSQKAIIYGTEGMIEIPFFWKAESARLVRNGKTFLSVKKPAGYEYEAREAARCLRKGILESDTMSLSESASIAKIVDRVRSKIGFPG